MTYLSRALAERILKTRIYDPNNYPNEQWQEISDFPEYSVSTYGRVIRHTTGYVPVLNRLLYGYERVKLLKNDRYWYRYRHDLVTDAFLPRPSHDHKLKHKNGNLTDNRVENLEWIK